MPMLSAAPMGYLRRTNPQVKCPVIPVTARLKSGLLVAQTGRFRTHPDARRMVPQKGEPQGRHLEAQG
jgi:hypothetical protein